MPPALAIVFVFLGCSLNVVFLEFLLRGDPGSGNIITFSQFLFIALEGFVFTTKFLTLKPVVPLSKYIKMVVMFFAVSVANNYAMKFNISMPLQMIFKSGSLMANMVLGILVLKKKYAASKYAAVISITVGIAVCTIASAAPGSASQEDFSMGRWSIGVGLLTFALFLSAQLGVTQELLYAKFGKHPKEALFYSHAMPLIGFVFLANDIYDHAIVFSNSQAQNVSVLGPVPVMWLFLAANVLTQYICIKSVFVLTTEFSSLTVTLVITLRKFASLIFSIFYFKNQFTLSHWLGTLFVFVGTLIFIDIAGVIRGLFFGKKKQL